MKKLFFLLVFCMGISSQAQIVNIPDANLKTRLIYLGVDLDNDGNIQNTEAQSFTSVLELNSGNIADFTGIESFTNVVLLRCRNNNISSLSLSNMPNLKSLDAGFNTSLTTINLNNITLDSLRLDSNTMSALDLSTFSSLKYLDCSYNHISSLNISNLTNLKVLNCASNWLTTIDVTPLLQLEELNCSMNQLSTINVTPILTLKSLICSNNSIPTLSLSNLPNLEHLEYGNNQSTSLTFSNLPNMKYVDCSGNSIVTLNTSVLPLLEYLDCSGNHLTSINVNGLIHLNYLTLALNQVATINISGLTSLNYFNASSNNLTTMTIENYPLLGTIFLTNNQLTNLTVSNLPTLSTLYCDYNQLNSLDLSNGINTVSYLYCNNNLLTNLNITGLVNLYWLDCHENLLTTIDFTGLTNLYTVLCDHNSLTTLDFSTATNFTNLSCSYNNLSSINIKNGNPFINTNNFWHENPNLTFVCADDGELTALNQILTQSINVNYGNVVVNTYCSFTPGGVYNTITGTAKYDFNNNGCDAGDTPLQNLKIGITNWSTLGATFTNVSGNYTFYTTLADQSITPELEIPSYFNVTPLTSVISFPSTSNLTQVQDFCISQNGNHQDLEVIVEPLTTARPGFNARYKLVFRNKGTMALSDWTGLTLSYNNSKMTFLTATQVPSSSSAGLLDFGYSLNPFESKSIEIEFNINAPTGTNPTVIGDFLSFVATINPVNTDETPLDNTYTYVQNVVGAYDPNAITCLEGENLATSEIGNYLHYSVMFENTGNYQTENIVVKDIIDTTKYDINSIQLLDSSNPVDTRITGNVVEFIFQNINLAATSGNPPVGGHGDILFKIKSLNNLVNGDMVTKSAKIYFDYNAPIDTNIAETTYSNLNNSIFQLDNSVSVAPNPTNSFINITSKFNIKSIELFDVQGRLLETSFENNTTTKIDLSGKQNGIYFLKINTENGSKVEKIVKK